MPTHRQTKALSKFPGRSFPLFFFNVYWLTFIFGCAGASLLRRFSLVSLPGSSLPCSTRAPQCSGFFCWSSQVCRLQGLWYMDWVAPQHVGSSRTRDWTPVPCVGGWILNHWTTSEVPAFGISDDTLFLSVLKINWKEIENENLDELKISNIFLKYLK